MSQSGCWSVKLITVRGERKYGQKETPKSQYKYEVRKNAGVRGPKKKYGGWGGGWRNENRNRMGGTKVKVDK
jgi:hypothetical protein